MTGEQWAQIKEIFGEALERAPAEREAFVRSEAKDDEALLVELLRLVKESERESDLLSRPVLANARAMTQDESPCFAPSMLVARRFQIVRFIARGGMGEVYEAHDLELGERVALKAIRKRAGAAHDLRALFKREIQLARRVTHPNVCRIFDLAQHDSGSDGDEILLLSMELIDGETLTEYLHRSGPLTCVAALPLIEDIAAGLQAVHDAGIVHGDLKPGNVMLALRPGEATPHARVMDFGMAFSSDQNTPASDRSKAEALPVPQDGDDTRPTLTMCPSPHVLVGGTPDYFAPEQTGGSSATTATDVYAFALVIGEILGVPKTQWAVHAPKNLPSRWARVLQRGLAITPARRYARPVELAGALRSALYWRSRTRRATILAAGVVLTVLVAAKRIDTFLRSTANGLVMTENASETVECPSPDGRFLAGTSWDTGDLILHDVSNGKIRRLTHQASSIGPQSGATFGALFSPDGRRIAYMWAGKSTYNEIRLIGADGKGERMLYRSPRNTWLTLEDWSSDGSKILFRISRTDFPPAQLATIDVANGALQMLEKPPGDAHAIFGVDNRSFLFDNRVQHNGPWEIHQLLPDGTESTLIGRTGSNQAIGWSPDRRRLIFSSDRRGQPGIWAVPISDRGVEGEPQELVSNSKGWEPVGLTRGGGLFYRQDSSTTDVYTAVLDLAAGKSASAPHRVTERFVGVYSAPNWSESGRQLVFMSTRELPAAALAVYDAQTAQIRDIHLDLEWAGRPQWVDHDGGIMVMGRAQNRAPGLYRVDPRTGDARLFRSGSELQTTFEGAWSRDGKFHFNRFQDARRGLFRLNLQTGERTILYIPPPGINMGLENLALSPDGRMLAFHVRNEAAGESSLMLIAVEGGPATPLFTVKNPQRFLYGSFTWTPDSQSILAASSRDVGNPKSDEKVSELWLVPAVGGSARRIEFPSMPILCLRLNADGKTIAFHSRHGRSEIWVIQKFL